MNLKGKVAAHRAIYRGRINKIAKKRFKKKYDLLSGSQKNLVDEEFSKDKPAALVTKENYHNRQEIENKIKNLPQKSKPVIESTKKQSVFILENKKTTECERISFKGQEKKIEDILENYPQILDENLFIIGRQVSTNSGNLIDLLGLDNNANVNLIEIKTDKSQTRKVLAQIIDYLDWVDDLHYEDLNEIAKKHGYINKDSSLMQEFEKRFNKSPPDRFNTDSRLFVVAEEIDNDTKKKAKNLREKYGMNVSCRELDVYGNGEQKIVSSRIIL